MICKPMLMFWKQKRKHFERAFQLKERRLQTVVQWQQSSGWALLFQHSCIPLFLSSSYHNSRKPTYRHITWSELRRLNLEARMKPFRKWFTHKRKLDRNRRYCKQMTMSLFYESQWQPILIHRILVLWLTTVPCIADQKFSETWPECWF